jgi:integral membrane protein (TIGR01906 family)
VTLTLGRFVGAALIAVATAVALVALAVLAFLNPLWVGFEQARTGADRFTGYTLDEVHRITNAVLGELIVGPATFLQSVAGAAVFDPREQAHLADVHRVLIGFFVVAVVALIILVGALLARRGRPWVLQGVAIGAGVLAGLVVVVGVIFTLFFDTAFDVFHRIFFAGGSYTFDPGEERLVQLFPEDFWSETSIALALVILALALATLFVARRAMRDRTPAAVPAALASRART